jgi:hypothetical protein
MEHACTLNGAYVKEIRSVVLLKLGKHNRHETRIRDLLRICEFVIQTNDNVHIFTRFTATDAALANKMKLRMRMFALLLNGCELMSL